MASNETTLDFSIVRDMRKRAGMTLEDVSKLCGITIAGLSKLERNQNMIELDTLYRLARVFGLSATDLLNLAESCSATKKDQDSYTSGPFDFDRVDFKGIQCYQATAKAGSQLSKPEAHGDDFEICWLKSGKMQINLPREKHLLEPGQALKFDAALEHTYEILEDSEITIIHLNKAHRF
ncbi:helix-turn-helix domain-containing protein [Cerasicoccus maritimus]|uniref:helix-turn-helix domain-containing protein n=1 Tax=Cerasicoccus maritimus TaxID=490089 RepID=UPI0028529C3C|nr:helix-turn-helix domain-containing protein [Cerasicoccus maritimus]